MAKRGNRWLLSIFLVIVPNTIYNMKSCLAEQGGPPPPSLLGCHIPYEYKGMMVRSAIQCVWDPGPPSKTPSIYTLHWESADSSEQTVRGSNTSAYIQPTLVSSHSELSVWVEAENQHGSASSPKSTFNTANIMKPATPTITQHNLEPLEIYWESKCSMQGLSEGHCQVRHRVAPDEGWPEVEEGFHGVYCLENVLPYSWYEFQVRCACPGSLLSDWSQVYKVESPRAAPVGLLDIWSECKLAPQSSECVLMWKRPPRWHAGGEILGYVVTLSRWDGTATVVNASTVANASDQLTCDKKRCHLKATLTNVTAVNISAFTAYGATIPACLHIPLSAQENRGDALQVEINSEVLVVSWNPPTRYINNQSKYVVQYKQAGLPQTKGFDWIRLDRSQMSATLTGQFEKYIAYQVALFLVSPNGSSDHISSAVGYVHQGIPPNVPSFEVVTVKANSVKVTWKPIPLPQRRGVIVCYQIGLDSQRVYNLSEPQGDEDRSFWLEHLDPGQNYEVWIRAITEAGPGPNSTVTFKTEDLEGFDYNILFVLAMFIPLISFLLMRKFSWVFKECIGFKKVPDPSNSHVFQKMNHQINGSMFLICVPVEEPDPVLSHLEIVKFQDEMAGGQIGDRGSQGAMKGLMDQGEWAGSGNTASREDCYSKMTDSDSDTDIFPSDYEKHFIPTAMDIMYL
ncbi:unnamed protein product [Lota lota]